MFTKADNEFMKMAEELYTKHHEDMNLEVHPSRVIFLRTDRKKKAYAYCKVIRGEYEQLSEKRFFIVVVSKTYDELDSEKKKQYVILHEMKHLSMDEGRDGNLKYCLRDHDIENFNDMLINPNWNLEKV